jgi:SAM-dependent methyltransferase
MPGLALPMRIFSRVVRDIKRTFGIYSYLKNEDRRILEQVIFPYFWNANDFQNVLFVGCHWYTAGYNKWFEEKQKNYWTIEIHPSRKRYGAKQHIIDGVQNIGNHFNPNSLDLILCNGVFGWGLDARPDVEEAFQESFVCLRDGGVLVVGWDDIDERRPFSLDQCRSLQKFQPFVFPPLACSRYVTDTPLRHTYDFFVKRGTPAVGG